jgi:outer membrane protein OmpA-like peptidoglycan-associated protein
MKTLFFATFFMLIGSNTILLIAQNLVVDGGFETLKNFTNEKSSWHEIVGTPDLWDTTGFCPNRKGVSFEKKNSAHSGKNYIGFYYAPDYYETIISNLDEPLKKDSIYEVSMFVKSPDKSPVVEHSDIFNPMKKFYVAFAKNNFDESMPSYLALSTPDNKFVSNVWTKVETLYRAIGGENRIVMSGFFGTNVKGNEKYLTYYFFDDLEVKRSSKNLIPIPTIEPQKVEDISNIYFDSDSFAIKETEREKLLKNLKILNANKNLAITIAGFTDVDGDDAYNVKLGEQRANNVKDFFAQNGYTDNDNIRIKSFGKSLATNADSKAKSRRVEVHLTPKQWNNDQKEAIMAVSKLYGYVRWFYPTSVLDTFNWGKFLNKTIIQISGIKDRETLRRCVMSRLMSIAPDLRFFGDFNTCLNYKKTIKPNTSLVYKKKINEGMGGGNKVYNTQLADCKMVADGFSVVYKSQNYTFKEADFVETLPLSISVYFPLILPTKQYSVSKIWADSMTNTMSDTISKYHWMVSGMMVWNAVQHFYPYLDALKIDWQPKMGELVEIFDKMTWEDEYVSTMQKLTVKLNDGHANFYNKSIESDMWLPFSLTNVNDKLIVSKSDDAKVKVNDELVKMDEINCFEQFRKDTALISGTKNRKIRSVLNSLTATNKHGTFSHLFLKRNNNFVEIDVKRDWLDDTIQPIQNLEKSLIYVDCSRLGWENIEAILSKINDSKGVIFDMREYLSDDNLIKILTHLMQKEDTANSWMQMPIYMSPNQKNVIFKKEGWALKPEKPLLTCPVVFLAGGGSISYNESMLGLIKHYKLGAIIGEKTAGSNGSRNWIGLPNNYQFSWTGMYVTLPDGSPLQGIGIEPDVLALPNPQLQTYEDYVLKTAVQYLLKK